MAKPALVFCIKANSSLVSHIIRSSTDVCRLMWFAVLNHVHFIKNPSFKLGERNAPLENRFMLLYLTKTMAFGPFGKIR
jgi:hypothetical protein